MRLAPRLSPSANISGSRTTFCRCTTKLAVSGSPASRTMAAKARLARMPAAVAADAVRSRRLGVLEAELHVVQPGVGQRPEPARIQPDAPR